MPIQAPSTTQGSRRASVRPRLAARAVVSLLACCAAFTGCRTLTRTGAMPQSVTSCRQLTQQGVNAMERGDWKRAETLLSRAVETYTVDADARRNYAETLWHRGALPEALKQLEEARRLANEDPGLAVRTGELYLAMGQTNSASRMCDEALLLDPKFAPAWTLRGGVARASGQIREALSDYQRSLSYVPDNHEVAVLVAESYRQLNEPERALLTLQTLADTFPPGEEPQQVLYLEGLALTALGRYGDAASALAQAAHRERPTPEIFCRLAEAEMLSGRYTNAQTALQKALTLDPNYPASKALSERLAMAASARQTIAR